MLLRSSSIKQEESALKSAFLVQSYPPEALLRPFKYINIMNETACKCNSSAVTNFSHLGPLCKECFVDVIHRRCRKAVKDQGWLKPGQKVHVLEDDSVQGRAVPILLKQVVKGLPIEYVEKGREDVLVVGETADDEAEGFLKQLFEGRIAPEEKTINLLEGISTAEIGKYCELEGIQGVKKEKSELRARLETLDNKYPGTFFALQKSRASFRKSF